MNKGTTVLMQMQSLISRFEFENLVKEYKTDKNVRTFSTWNLLQVMLLAHCAGKKSLRDICSAFKGLTSRFYHLGFCGVSRNNLSNALAKRNSELFENLFYKILQKIRKEAGQRTDKRFRFKNQLFAIDSTTISLCLNLCEWASFRSKKGGVKIHTMLDVKMGVPDFMVVTEARRHDHTALSDMPFRAGAIYVLDRGYFCLKTLENINKNDAFFVMRPKSNTQYGIIRKNKVSGNGIIFDQIISFSGTKSVDYQEPLRLIRFENPSDGKIYDYITNNTDLAASTIATIYKSRWDIELFFKWMKQNVKINSFFGRSKNAVMIQIWTAAITFLLMEYIRFLSKTKMSLTEVFRIIGSYILSDNKISDLLGDPPIKNKIKIKSFDIQLDFGF